MIEKVKDALVECFEVLGDNFNCDKDRVYVAVLVAKIISSRINKPILVFHDRDEKGVIRLILAFHTEPKERYIRVNQEGCIVNLFDNTKLTINMISNKSSDFFEDLRIGYNNVISVDKCTIGDVLGETYEGTVHRVMDVYTKKPNVFVLAKYTHIFNKLMFK